jgi:hypothetical protein
VRNSTLKPDSKVVGTDQTALDFWQWGFSNILTNNLRGVFAEFLVGTALGCLDQPRVEWDSFDLVFEDMKIEVKSSAYIQSWNKQRYSNISFTIGAKKEYDYETNTYSTTAKRSADLYVFCLLKEKDTNEVNPLNTAHWEFYVVSTKELDLHFPHQKTISLASLRRIAKPYSYDEIKGAVMLLDCEL